jgi:hypothetical protein
VAGIKTANMVVDDEDGSQIELETQVLVAGNIKSAILSLGQLATMDRFWNHQIIPYVSQFSSSETLLQSKLKFIEWKIPMWIYLIL